MDKFALSAPLPLVKLVGRFLFWPIALSQHAMYRLGWFPWYSEIVKTSSGGRLLLGGLPWPHSMQTQLVGKEHVSAVVNLVSEKKIEIPGIERCDVPMTDFVHPEKSEVEKAVDFIENSLKNGKTVYVHCRAGKGRSATVVMCWLVSRMGYDPLSAQQFLQSRRPQILNNLHSRQVVQAFHRPTD